MKNGGTLVVVAGCGSQKSYQSRLWMAKVLRADDRILAISCRVIHACDCFRELESLGFVVYTERAYVIDAHEVAKVTLNEGIKS